MMHLTQFAVLLALPTAIVASGTHTAPSTTGPGFIHAPLKRADVPGDVESRRPAAGKRASSSSKTASATVGNLQRRYSINITIGGQDTMLMIDTGSSELWVNPNCSQAQESVSMGSDFLSDEFCQTVGRYDPGTSKTSKSLGSFNTLSYGDSSQTILDYYTDTVDVAGLAIDKQQFGVTSSSSGVAIGLLGLAPDAHYGYNNTPPTDNSKINALYSNASYELPLANMASQGLINRAAFSLDLRDDSDTTGSLIFGGIDKGKFSDELADLEVYTVTQQYEDYTWPIYAYNISIASVGVATAAGTETLSASWYSFHAILDSGTPNNIIPTGFLEPICAAFGAQYDGAHGICVVPCATRNASLGAVEYGLDGGTSSGLVLSNYYRNIIYETNIVDYALMLDTTVAQLARDVNLTAILPAEDMTNLNRFSGFSDVNDDVTNADQSDGSIPPICYLNTFTSDDPGSWILGAPLLRDAYAVFDWEAPRVYVGQAADCGTDVVAFGKGSGPDAIPRTGNCDAARPTYVSLANATASVAAAAASVTAATSSKDSSGGGSSSSSSSSSSSGKSSNKSSGSASVGIGVGVGAAAAGVVVLGSGVFIWRRVMASRARSMLVAAGADDEGRIPAADEAKVPLAPESTEEYGRLSQVQTQYDSPAYGH